MAYTCNVGGADKVLRISIGFTLAIVAALADISGVAKGALAIVAAIALLTAFVGFCPLNRLLGINTCKRLA